MQAALVCQRDWAFLDENAMLPLLWMLRDYCVSCACRLVTDICII